MNKIIILSLAMLMSVGQAVALEGSAMMGAANQANNLAADAKFSQMNARLNTLEGELRKAQGDLRVTQSEVLNILACNRNGQFFDSATQACSGSEPEVRTVISSGSAFRFATAKASCGGDEVLVGGGGICASEHGTMMMPRSFPDGNGWNVACDTTLKIDTTAQAYALCLKK